MQERSRRLGASIPWANAEATGSRGIDSATFLSRVEHSIRRGIGSAAAVHSSSLSAVRWYGMQRHAAFRGEGWARRDAGLRSGIALDRLSWTSAAVGGPGQRDWSPRRLTGPLAVPALRASTNTALRAASPVAKTFAAMFGVRA